MVQSGESQSGSGDKVTTEITVKEYENYIAGMILELQKLAKVAGRQDVADSLSKSLALVRAPSGDGSN